MWFQNQQTQISNAVVCCLPDWAQNYINSEICGERIFIKRII